ncbi:MAG: 4Fe-4S ferredoxin [Anaerocolumna sp.]|jgi:ferredoxin/flavodoxin|nr:4Fe-4S ferredoxin [Anaerocolumna sp.]
MIFYFSGTGNSLQVAKNIATYQEDTLISIASLMNSGEDQFEFSLKPEELVGFIFPVYGWAPPKMVLDFIKKLKINNVNDAYVFSVVTCGENIGKTMEMLDKKLVKQNIHLDSGFSVVMPSNYMLLGMDVDSPYESEKKLSEIGSFLIDINQIIENRQKDIFVLEKGTHNVITSLVGLAFSNYNPSTKKFYANDNCTSCGICEKVCNSKTIVVKDKPIWGNKCTQCLACINLCPVKAIEYGKATEKRGRYHNPNIKIDELGK